MKKNILKATLVVAFALIAGMNVYNAQQSDVMSDLALANVEALAGSEYDRPFYVAPCKNGPGSECRSTKYDEGNRCGTLTYC